MPSLHLDASSNQVWRRARKLGLSCLLGGLLSTASADPFAFEWLKVYRDGAPSDWLQGNQLWLGDGFDNGDPFLGPLGYTLLGVDDVTHVGLAAAEHDSRLWLDPAYGRPVANATGSVGRSLRLRLQTNTTDANNGLPLTRTFAGVLALPLDHLPAPGQSVGFRFSDTYNDSSNVIELHLSNGSNGLGIVFREQDFAAGTITPLGFASLAAPNGASSLVLSLSHASANSKDISGSFGYLAADGSLLGSLTTFTERGHAFDGEDHTRIELRVTQAVPEPASWALWFAGLTAALAKVRRRRA